MKKQSFLLALLLLTAPIAFSQVTPSIADKYCAALDRFDFKTAYDLIHPNEQALKSYKDFVEDYPVTLLKGFRLLNPKFFHFKVTGSNKTDAGIEHQVKTVMALRNKGKMFREQSKNLNKEAQKTKAAFTPEYVRKMMTKTPGADRMFNEQFFTLVEVDGKLIVGFKKEMEEEAAFAEQQRKGQIEFDSQKLVRMSSAPTYQIKEAVEGLRAVKDQIPQSSLITFTLPMLEKEYAVLQNLKISIDLEKQKTSPHRFLADLENNSDKTLGNLTIWYEFKDANGTVLLTTENPQPYTDNTRDSNKIPPGYKGPFKFGMLGDSEAELIQKATSVAIEIKSVYTFD